MSSGWPPEDDDRRWETARHPSAVGAGHESRGAERGYSGIADYEAEGQYPQGQYAGEQYPEGQYSDGQEGSWYGTAETSYPPADYQPQPDNAGYGEVSYPDVYDLNAPADGAFPQQGYGPYEPAQGYGPPAGYTEHPSFPNLPAHPPYGAPVAADYDTGGYQNGYADQDFGPGRVPAGRARAG